MSAEHALTPVIISSGGNDWDLAASNRISSEETTRILAEYQATGDINLRNEVVQSNLRLVAYLAGRFKGKGLSIDELMSEGAAALLRATETFDTERGVSFGAYAATAISHSMRRALGTVRHVVAVPSQVRRRISRHRRESDTFFAQHGRQPMFSEMSSESRGQAASPTPVAFTAAASTDVSADQSMMPAATPDAAEAVLSEDVRERVRKAVDSLDPRTAAVISLRFGLDSGTPRTWQRVAQHLGISVSEVKARTAEGMAALRGRLSPEMDDEPNHHTSSRHNSRGGLAA